ncbi:MAG: SMEK domain-containing protein [Candidatus Aminicenantes bacterium]|nr:SMEK domain-containing protein [Candidatus Aminicenantes bacterium]
MKMNDDFSRLETLIARWVVETGLHAKSGSTDKNKYSEYIAAQLLNAAFSYRLEVLPQNHPAVDLGDPVNGIAFSITSRTDADKIRSDLQTFHDHNLIAEYPQGIRFLLLVDKKEDWSTKIKDSFTEILAGFDADEHIFTLANVVERLKRNYPANPGPFHDILAFLEWQFGEKAGEPPLPFLREMLLHGSRSYHRALTGENGRFRNLHIEDLLLSRSESESRWVPQPVSLEGDNNGCQTNETVITMLPRLWNRPVEHAVIVGEGGMGKTVSLVRLWETYLNRAAPGTDEPIPVFIALHEFNNTDTSRDFIRSRIADSYLDDDRLRKGLKKLFKTRGQRSDGITFPNVVLLLDGFNEITVEKRELLLELNRMVEECQGVQVLLTSRYDMRGNFNWGHWNLVKLNELEEENAVEYLRGKGLAMPEQERLRKLLCNPMMLTLYAVTCEVQANHRDNRYCHFKETVDAPGELLWNFMEAQVAQLPERVGPEEGRVVYYWFLLKYILPGLGFEMEKAGLFVFSHAQFLESLDRLCQRFALEDFLTAIPLLSKYLDMLLVGECGNTLARHKRAGLLRDIFCNELHMLVEEGQSLRFLHQDFRDFFAAMHVLNEVEIGLSKGEIPGILKERILDYFVRRLVGEIEGEHRCKPYLVEGQGWNIDINTENRLHRVVDLCRGKFNNQEQLSKVFGSAEPFFQKGFCQQEAEVSVGYTVWNIITIWKEVRRELSGADLSNLDLSGISLNGVTCSRYYEFGDRDLVYLAAIFDGSRVHGNNLFAQGHSSWVNSAVYSPDGSKILSASEDYTIKGWDAGTGECVKTLSGHTWGVKSAVYSADGKKILSASNDRTIKEWNAGTAECLKTLVGHTDRVNCMVYSADGEKILSGSHDKTIKEWCAGTGECLKTLVGHTDVVWMALYSADGKKILSASEDYTIKEWDAGTGECLKTLVGHTWGVESAVYSVDGKKILSGSHDKTIKEWCAGTGECVKTLAGHTNSVNSAVYSGDGKKILSASDDNTIKEWDADIGVCLKTITGHTNWVTSAVYSPDGKKILSTSKDHTIKEWDAGTSECLKTLAGNISSVTYAVVSPDEKKIISDSRDQIIKEWDAQMIKVLNGLTRHTNWVYSAVFSPDGEKILSASGDKIIREWDMGTGECLKILAGHTRTVNRAVYSADGKKILSTSDDRTIKEWDAGTGECLKTLAGHTDAVWMALYSADGKRILSTSDDYIIKEWDVGSGECLKTLAGHTDVVWMALYSADGKKILSTSDDYILKEWDAATGQCLNTYDGDDPNIPRFTPDEKNIELRTEGNKIYIPDASGQKERELINVPGLFIQGCSFQNLEKGSQWSEEGLAILKQYHAEWNDE